MKKKGGEKKDDLSCLLADIFWQGDVNSLIDAEPQATFSKAVSQGISSPILHLIHCSSTASAACAVPQHPGACGKVLDGTQGTITAHAALFSLVILRYLKLLTVGALSLL